MAGLFDDLIPAQPVGAPAPAGMPGPVAAAPAGAGLFDDLIPAQPGQPAPLTVQGGPRDAGEAFDAVEGTGRANYDTAPGDTSTPWQRVQDIGGAAVAAMDGFANAIPFTDRIAALAAAGTGIGGKFGDYSGNLTQLRKEEGAAMEAHPLVAKAGEFAGGAALPLPAVGWIGKGAAATAKAAAEAKALETGVAAVKDTTPLWVKAVRGGTVGAGIGAAQGASSSDDLTDPWQTGLKTGIGGTVGFGAGALVPALAHGASALSRMVKRDTVAPIPGVSNAARDVVLGALDKDGAANVQRNAALYGDEAMAFDYGKALRGVAQGLATKDGPAASPLVDALGYRQAATNARVRRGLVDNFGPAEDPAAVKAAIGDVRDAATAPLFARAAAAGVPWTAESQALMGRPAVATAMRGAAHDAANAGRPLPTVVLDEAGNPVASDAALQAYAAGQRPALTAALARLTGSDPNMGPLAATDALMTRRSAEADPLYRAYRTMDVPMTPELAEVLGRPSVARAIPDAERKAQDQGRSIFVPRSEGAPPTPQGVGLDDIPDVTDGLGPGPGVLGRQGTGQAAEMPFMGSGAPQRPTGPAPMSLQSFLQRAGVQDPGGDLRAAGLGRIPGLIRETGLPLDRAREAAAEAGYLGGDTARAVRETTPNDLLDALGNHPTYSAHDEDAVAARRDWDSYQASRGGPTAHDLATEAVRSHLVDTGVPAASLDPRVLDVAAHLHGRGMDPGDAWETAAMSPPFPGDMPRAPRAAAGPPAPPPPPQLTPEGLDYLKRTLGDKIDTAQRAGSRDDAAIYTGLQHQLLGAIERHPDPSIADAYGAARRAYAGPSREMDALNAGREAVTDAVTPEMVGRQYGALQTDGERQRFRDGVFSALRDKLGKASDTANFVRTVAGSQALRDKFAAIAPHPEALDAFHGAIGQAQAQFTEAQRPTPSAWRATLERLDAQAAKGDAGAASARDALAAHLDANPDFARARGIGRDYAGLQGGVDYGRESLAGGGNPIWPQGFAERFAAMTPAEQAAVRTGQRSLMEEAVGLKPNDQLAIKGLFQTGNTPGYTAPGVGPGAPDLSGWNAQKLAAAYGEAPVSRMQEALNANDAFNATFNSVAQNSETARRKAMVKALEDAEWKPRDLMDDRSDHATVLGLAKQGVAKAVNAAAHAFQNAPSNAVRDMDLARIGTLTGPERDAMMGQLYDRLPAYQGREAAADASRRQVLAAAAILIGGASAPLTIHRDPPADVLARALREGSRQ